MTALKQENEPDDPVEDEPSQKTPAPRQQERYEYDYGYEHDKFHRSPFYMTGPP